MLMVTLLVFLTVVFTMIAGYHLVGNLCFPDAARVRQRLAREFGDDVEEEQKSPLFKDLAGLNIDAGPISNIESALSAERPGLRKRMQTLLQQANLNWSIRTLMLAAIFLGFGGGIVVLWFVGPWFAFPAAIAGAAAPYFYVEARRNRRRDKMLRQLPSAFELMARIINAGQSVMQAFHAVADSFDDPLSAEFAKCLHEQKLGLRPEATLPAMAYRSGIMEMRIFAMAMLIQQQSGGKLSEVLQRLAEVVRARVQLKRKVRTLTAEGRMQGWTLVVLPFVAFAAMMIVNQQYAEMLLEQPSLIAATVAAMGIGHLWIRKIVNFEQ